MLEIADELERLSDSAVDDMPTRNLSAMRRQKITERTIDPNTVTSIVARLLTVVRRKRRMFGNGRAIQYDSPT
jgi:hypothetical protein